MQKTKRFSAILLALVMLTAFVPVLPAASAATDGDYEYKISNGNAIITKYTGAGGDVTIPNTLGGYPVTEIDSKAFQYCYSLTGVTIPKSVTRLGFSAFERCTKLKSIVIPYGVTWISISMFEGCFNLTDVTIPASVTEIGMWAFAGCTKLTDVTIPASVTTISYSAFRECTSLTEFTIPASVTKLNTSFLGYCTSLLDIKVDASNPAYRSIDGVVYSMDMKSLVQYPGGKSGPYTIPAGVTEILGGSFAGCTKLTAVSVPDGVTTIGDYAFAECSALASANIPDGVTTIDSNAFYNCSALTSISIPDGVTTIGSYAFSGCIKLTSISIPNSVTTIGYSTFYRCEELASVTLPDNMTKIPDGLFARCKKLTAVTIPGGVKTIGSGAFSECISLTEITIPDSVTTIEKEAFEFCSGLRRVTIGEGVTTISNNAFEGCSELTEIALGSNVKTIGSDVFAGCTALTSITVSASNSNYASVGGVLFNKGMEKLIACPNGMTSYTIPNSVTTIGDVAFKSCGKLESISIPNSVTTIGKEAFASCYGLKSLTIPDSVVSVGDKAFSGCTGLNNLTIGSGWCPETNLFEQSPIQTLTINNSTYKNAFEGVVTLQTVNLGSNVEVIRNFAFRNCTQLVNINISGNIRAIGSGAFYNTGYYRDHPSGAIYIANWLCAYKETGTNGTTLTVEPGTVGIAASAVSGKTEIKTVILPDSVTRIGEATFADCTGLESVIFPKNLETIGAFAFNGCTSLKSIDLPDSLEIIGEWAFAETGLVDVVIPNKVTDIGSDSDWGNAFAQCKDLKSIVLGDSVKTTGEFMGCYALESITFGKGLTSYYDLVFYDCSNLKEILVHKDNAKYSSQDGVLFNKKKTVIYLFPDGKKGTYTVPDSVTSIAYTAFVGCDYLTAVTVPNSVKKIGFEAFHGCDKLTIYCKENSTAHKFAVANKIPYSFGTAPTTYTVSFNKNGGSGTMADQTFTEGKSQALTANSFTRKNYRFTGWNTQKDGAGTKYTDGMQIADIVLPGESITLYAQWESFSGYTVTFNKGAGSGSWKTLSKADGSTATITKAVTKAFTRKGYVFAHFLGSDGKQYKSGDKVTVNGDLTLTAKYSKVSVNKGSTPTLSKESGKIRVKYNKVSGAAGYQFVVSTSKTFASGKGGSKTYVGYKKNYIQTCAKKALKSGTTYYVKIRAYKLDSTGAKVWGAYSTVKSIKF